jgi:hypothetical protein
MFLNAKVKAQASVPLYCVAAIPEKVAQYPKHNFSPFTVILAKFSWKYRFSASDFSAFQFF